MLLKERSFMKKWILLFIITSINSCGNPQEKNATLRGDAYINNDISNPAIKRSNFKDTLIVGSPEMSGNFLPVYYTTAYDAQVTSLIYEGLLTLDDDGEFIPHLAEAMPQISENGTTYTIKLKKGIKFHSGKELTADDVVFTYTLLADPSYDGRFTSAVQDLISYEEYSQRKTKTFTGVEKLDDYTVRFYFKERLFSNISSISYPIMDSQFYAFPYNDISAVKAKMTQLIGTGAYILKTYVPKQYVELTINENYWGEKPKIKNIIIKQVSPNTDVQELVLGNIDILPNIIEPEKILTADETGYITRNQYIRHGYGYMMFNNAIAPTSDKKVRQALLYGLNREAINQIYFKELATTVDAPVSTVYWTYDNDLEEKMIKYEYNPKKAAQLLEEAGWILTNGKRMKDGKALILDWSATKDLPFIDVLTPILLDNYQKLGIEIRISLIDFTSLIDKIYNERTGFHMFNMAISEATIPSPFNVWHSRLNVRGGSNTAQYSNPKVDALLDKMKRTLDKEEFKKLWQEFILIMNEDVPLLPLYTNIYTDLINRRVINFNTSSLKPWYYAVLEAELADDN